MSNSGGSWSTMSENILNDKYPLHRACRDGDVATLSNLLEDPLSKEHLILEDAYYGWTPSHWAAYFGRVDCMRVLCGMNKHGFSAPVDTRTTRFSQSPLHIAAFAGHPQCMQWLLQTGAAADARDYLGETPLHKSARSGSTECVSLLATQKSCLGLINNNSQSAAQLAEACGHHDLGKHLLQLEAAQGAVRDSTCSITKSIPAHGINAGLFPQSPATVAQINKPVVPSNGYYGFQPTTATNGTNGHAMAAASNAEDCDMETDATPSATNGTGSHQNGSVSNGINQDITLDPAVCQNQVPIGGRKRSREDSPMPQMKRTRREECSHQYQSLEITQAPRDVVNTVSDKLTTCQNSSLNSGASTHQPNNHQVRSSLSGATSPSCASLARARIKQQWIWVV